MEEFTEEHGGTIGNNSLESFNNEKCKEIEELGEIKEPNSRNSFTKEKCKETEVLKYTSQNRSELERHFK